MLNNITKAVLISAGAMAVAVVSTPSQAIPAFARQTGKACMTCHFQHFPVLNAYGRDFKLGGYTDMGKQGTVKGKDLSLPEVLNMSAFFKMRYMKSNGADTPGGVVTSASGDWQVPDEFALISGGRIAEGIGYLLELDLRGVGTAPLAAFKMPMKFKIADNLKAGVTLFSVAGLGAAAGSEILSTGSSSAGRVMERRRETSGFDYVGTSDSAAMGVAFSLSNQYGMVAFTKWSPNHAATAQGQGSRTPSSTYIRAIFTPTVGDWDLAFGLSSWSGSSYVGAACPPAPAPCVNNAATNETRATGFDAQAQGAVAGYPLGVYFTSVSAPASSAAVGAAPNFFNANVAGTVNPLTGQVAGTKKATTLMAELGVIPNKLMVQLGHRFSADLGDGSGNDSATTFGVRYNWMQNVALQLEHSTRSSVPLNAAGVVARGALGAGRYAGSQTLGTAETTMVFSAGF